MVNTIEVKKTGDIVIVSIVERFDSATAPDAEKAFLKLLESGEKRFVCDFSGTIYVASAGMRVLLMAAKTVSRSGGKVAFCSLTPGVRKVFEIAGFTQIFPVFTTCDEAVTALA